MLGAMTGSEAELFEHVLRLGEAVGESFRCVGVATEGDGPPPFLATTGESTARGGACSSPVLVRCLRSTAWRTGTLLRTVAG